MYGQEQTGRALYVGEGKYTMKNYYARFLIGIVAGLMSLVGVRLGERVSGMFGRRVEFFGGMVLIFIGVRIVLEHTGLL